MSVRQLKSDLSGAALEARFAHRLVSALDERDVDHDVGQRLRVARELAVTRARQARAAAMATASSAGPNGRGTAAMGGSPWWLRLASVAPLLMLAFGLVLIDRLNSLEQIRAAAEIDAVLLADELPPTAYSDPGFAEFLRQPGP